MSEVLIHLVIPAAALILAGFNRKLVLLFCAFAVIPDIDVIFGVHRSFLHSFLFIGVISFCLWVYTYHYKPQWKSHVVIISLLLLSHPFLDLFTAPVQILWPVDSYFYIQITPPTFDVSTLSVNLGAFMINFFILSPEAAAPLITPTGPITLFTNEGLIAFALLGIAILYWFIRGRKTMNLDKERMIQTTEGRS